MPLLAYLNSLSYAEAASLVGRDLLSIKRDLSRHRTDGQGLAKQDPELANDWQDLSLPAPPPEDAPEPGDGGGVPPPKPKVGGR